MSDPNRHHPEEEDEQPDFNEDFTASANVGKNMAPVSPYFQASNEHWNEGNYYDEGNDDHIQNYYIDEGLPRLQINYNASQQEQNAQNEGNKNDVISEQLDQNPRGLTKFQREEIINAIHNESSHRFDAEEGLDRPNKSAKVHNEYDLDNTIGGFNSGEKAKTVGQNGSTLGTSCKDAVYQKRKLIMIASIVFLVLVGVGVGLGVGLSKRAQQDEQKKPEIMIQFCNNHPSQCTGIPAQVTDYILTNYTEPDQVRSLLQVSRTLNLVPANTTTTTNLSRDALVQTFRSVVRSVECMAYILPTNYADAYQMLTELQFSSREALEFYLNMTESFSGQPLRLTNLANIESTCRFNITSPARRRRLQEAQTRERLGTSNCTRNNSVLIYFNGIGYSPSAAIENLKKITDILGTNSSANFDAGVIAVGAWRKDGELGFLMSTVLAYQQLVQQSQDQVPPTIDLMSYLRMIVNLCTVSARLPSSIARQAYRRFRTFFIRTSIESFINEEIKYNIQRHKDFVTQQLNEGKKVVLLAHAEGTLYANKVYGLLTDEQKQSVSLVYVAPAANSMADGSSNYITNPSDYFITALRAYALIAGSFPSPLRANMEAASFDFQLDSGLNHDIPGYAQAYKPILTELLVSAKARAAQPAMAWGSGPITVTLTWDEQPDVDLHIFQPGGRHVYYASRSGNNGYLDVDDVNGYGPEHYYTNCSLQEGDYTFRLNYYRGYATSQTIVTVAAGSEFLMKNFAVYPPLSYSGNNEPPYFVGTVTVVWSEETGSYRFTITS